MYDKKKVEKIGNVPNVSWFNLDNHEQFDKWTKKDGDIFQSIDKNIDKIKNSDELQQYHPYYADLKERYLKSTKKQLERRGKVGSFKGHRK